MNDYSAFLQDFYHTRQSLEAFESCPLKFYKRYCEGLRWDRPLDAGERAAIDRGSDFHMLARRYFLGVESGISEASRDFEKLSGWMKNLIGAFEIRNDAVYLPEYKLRYEGAGLRLEANFDLVISSGGKLEIWDWKTHALDNNVGPSYRERLEKSLQTMVYLYVLKERSVVFGREYDFTDIGMYYWQPEPARVIAGVTYSRQLHESFGARLEQLVENIRAFDMKKFDKSLYAKSCRNCEFNWYCAKYAAH